MAHSRARLVSALASVTSTFASLWLSACGGAAPSPATVVASPSPSASVSAETAGPPVAAQRPVTHSYHGVDVSDPYEWLENPADADVRAWSDGQNAYARRVLGSLPNLAPIRARVQQILSAATRSHRDVVQAGGKTFALEMRPPREQPFIVVMDAIDAPDAARVLVDPTTLDASGGVAIDWFVPSPDGRLLAVSLSRGGSERGDVSLFDVATGRQVHETIEHVHGGTAGGDLAWLPDSSGFLYTRYPRSGERSAEDENFFQQVYFHAVGTPVTEDRYELGRDLPRIAEIQLEAHPTNGRILATVQNGDGGEFAIYLRERDGRWRTLCNFPDRVVQAAFGPRDDLFLISRKDAPRGKLLRVGIDRLELARASVVIPEGSDTIVSSFGATPVVVTPTRIHVTYQLGGPSELRTFDLRGRPQPQHLEQPPVSAVQDVVATGNEGLLVRHESFVTPSAWVRFDGRATQRTALADTSPVDTASWEVRREMAPSHDGTQVPVNILAARGIALDGSHPCVVNGYGGYGVNISPRFRPLNALYLENGVVFAIANLRGGGEFGEAWHTAGNLTRKQNVFDDFHAAVQHMIDRGYTRSEHLAIIGGSNGGLLMGATLTQHPDLVHAVVSFVGIYDMLRVELSPNGSFNVTEFGTVQNEEQFRALHAYSPYHRVTDGTRYPASLFLTGANDPRVEPWHSRKMVARLQAANSASTPILLRTSDTSGHGIGTALSEEIAEMSDVFAFLFAELGVTPSTTGSSS